VWAEYKALCYGLSQILPEQIAAPFCPVLPAEFQPAGRRAGTDHAQAGRRRLKLLRDKGNSTYFQIASPPFGVRDFNILYFIAASWLQSF